MQIKAIGIDLGKTTFHLVALGYTFPDSSTQEVFPLATTGLHSESAIFVNWAAGGGRIALSGASPTRTRARGAPDSRTVRATVREVQQKRLLRCGSACRGGGTGEHAFRPYQNGGSD